MAVVKKIKQDTKSIKSLIFSTEELITKSVQHLFPGSWGEEEGASLISRSLASLLDEKKLQVFGSTLNIKAASFKKTAESKHFASIGIHVTINFHDDQELQGVCFYDIHARDRDKHTFSTLRKDHLRSLNAHAHQSRLLLLDYDPIPMQSMAVGPDFLVGGSAHSWHHWMGVTHGTSVHAESALHLGEKSRSLYKLGLPFSYQLVFRHLFGHDLQFNDSAVAILTGNKIDKGNPSHILQLGISFNKEINTLPDIGLNGSMYR